MTDKQIKAYRTYIKFAIRDAEELGREERVSALKYSLDVFEGVLAGRMIL